jgi:hypothetical protein
MTPRKLYREEAPVGEGTEDSDWRTGASKEDHPQCWNGSLAGLFSGVETKLRQSSRRGSDSEESSTLGNGTDVGKTTVCGTAMGDMDLSQHVSPFQSGIMPPALSDSTIASTVIPSVLLLKPPPATSTSEAGKNDIEHKRWYKKWFQNPDEEEDSIMDKTSSVPSEGDEDEPSDQDSSKSTAPSVKQSAGGTAQLELKITKVPGQKPSLSWITIRDILVQELLDSAGKLWEQSGKSSKDNIAKRRLRIEKLLREIISVHGEFKDTVRPPGVTALQVNRKTRTLRRALARWINRGLLERGGSVPSDKYAKAELDKNWSLWLRVQGKIHWNDTATTEETVRHDR